MKIKPLIALVMLSTLVLSFSVRSFADKTTSSVKNKDLTEETPHITNEAEYAEFVKKREGAGQTSSVKSKLSIKPAQSIKSSLSNNSSSSRAKTSSN
jgi:hypothetical protein